MQYLPFGFAETTDVHISIDLHLRLESKALKFWNLLAFVEDDHLIKAAKYSEHLGFDAVGVSDHLFIPEDIQSRYPGSKGEGA